MPLQHWSRQRFRSVKATSAEPNPGKSEFYDANRTFRRDIRSPRFSLPFQSRDRRPLQADQVHSRRFLRRGLRGRAKNSAKQASSAERRRGLIYQEAEITPGNRAQWRIVRGQASALITDVPAFVDFHSSIRRCLWCSPTDSVETRSNPHLSAST